MRLTLKNKAKVQFSNVQFVIFISNRKIQLLINFRPLTKPMPGIVYKAINLVVTLSKANIKQNMFIVGGYSIHTGNKYIGYKLNK